MTMGYTTYFDGTFKLNKELDEETYHYLNNFSGTRRMKRDPKVLERLGYGPAESFGVDGEFFVKTNDLNSFGETEDESIVEYNYPPSTQPGLWCQWVPSEDRMHIEWDQGEKFYHADEWIKYIIEKILIPRGYVLDGVVEAEGEEREDNWHIEIKNNVVEVSKGTYEEKKRKIEEEGKWEQLNDILFRIKEKCKENGDKANVEMITEIEEKIEDIRG